MIELKLCVHNPFNKQDIPIFIHKTLDFGPHLDCHIGIPSVSQEDLVFAQAHKLDHEDVLNKENLTVTNSGNLNKISKEEATRLVSKQASEMQCGGHVTSSKARDWLISRQRYWGTPIPMVHCPKYGPVPVPYEDLPVILPPVETFTGKGSSPLTSAEDWLKVKCSK